MAASSRSTKAFAGTRQLAAALVATLALALVLVAGIGTLAMNSRTAPNAHPVVSTHTSVAGSGSSASGDPTRVTPARTFRDLAECRPPAGRHRGVLGPYDPSMADGDRPTKRLSESTRVEAFSDGVFSIAITLLVLELADPGGARRVRRRSSPDEWVSYVAYLAAFASIGVLWMGHHTAFSRIRGRRLRPAVAEPRPAPDRRRSCPFPTAVIASAFRVGIDRRPGGGRRRVRDRRDGVGRRLAAAVQLSRAATRTSSTRRRTPHFFRLTEAALHARRLRGRRPSSAGSSARRSRSRSSSSSRSSTCSASGPPRSDASSGARAPVPLTDAR